MAKLPPKLDAVAEAFYSNLPPVDYPKALIEEYPDIANHIFSLVGDKSALRLYLEDMLADRHKRIGRRDFQYPVRANIQNLYDLLVGAPGGFVDSGLTCNKPIGPNLRK